MPRHPPPRLSEREEAAWFGLLRFHSLVTRELDASLLAEHGMSLVEYEVLLKVSLAGGRIRMSELAQAALLSRSGLTRIVDELEGRAFLRREPDAADGRVLFATMTAAGRRRFLALRRTHLANVHRLFLDRLDDATLETLGRAWDTLAATLPEPSGRPRRPALRSG